MTVYSVYAPATLSYDYYEGPSDNSVHAGAPPIRSHAKLGATPEQAAWLVPFGAKKIGSGDLPQGRIAVLRGSQGGLGDLPASSPVKIVALAAVVYLAWRHFR